MPRTLRVIEVIAITVSTHISYKALKLLEPHGQNNWPGLMMIVVGLSMLLIHRYDFASYGIFSSWRYGLNFGVVFCVVKLAILAIEAGMARARTVDV
jgi:hypothetical protein